MCVKNFFSVVLVVVACSAEYDLFQIELSKNYGLTEWRDDLKKVMIKAGVENNPIVFLFSDTQVSVTANCFCYY